MEAINVHKHYGSRSIFAPKRHTVSAVSGVSLRIGAGSSLALIGESGSGKSTLGRLLAGLEKPTGGEIRYRGRVISNLSWNQTLPLRKKVQMIFQNSAAVFDPSYPVGYSVMEIIRNTENISAETYDSRLTKILEQVGLDKSYASRMSAELSGGQRQRLNIARALVSRPEFVVCDEPISSLDYVLRKQILNLLNRLRSELNLSYLFITHDIACVPYVCDWAAIMYRGQIVEHFNLDTADLRDAAHPYTVFLRRSIPARTPSERRTPPERKGEPFYPAGETGIAGGPGTAKRCGFYPRCTVRVKRCEEEEPPPRYLRDSHMVLCHCL